MRNERTVKASSESIVAKVEAFRSQAPEQIAGDDREIAPMSSSVLKMRMCAARSRHLSSSVRLLQLVVCNTHIHSFYRYGEYICLNNFLNMF